MNNSLTNDSHLYFSTRLAMEVGLNEAIFLEYLKQHLSKTTIKLDGYSWICKTYEEWRQEFPFWSRSTHIRAIKALEDQGLVISTTDFNLHPFDRTKWYRIDYEKLSELV
ncbi:hypothetical protein [Lysinibacillus fusiformis]|uniref:hypothetical protein n=1 Tax=Lysinibacillus fusiformis TaxID=28031 RepID=UPI00263B384E|nr:hypothetical protein [Lysinibacillus fusiformis]MDC6268046.1 hypothetical protein [Lysinibacillus sphaericus]MDN4967464.1 hypothetical protein [Lysinibacillus fusiformis]